MVVWWCGVSIRAQQSHAGRTDVRSLEVCACSVHVPKLARRRIHPRCTMKLHHCTIPETPVMSTVREREGGVGLVYRPVPTRHVKCSSRQVRTYRAHGKRHAVRTSGKAKLGRVSVAAAKGTTGAGAARVHPGPSLALPAVSIGVGHVQLLWGRTWGKWAAKGVIVHSSKIATCGRDVVGVSPHRTHVPCST